MGGVGRGKTWLMDMFTKVYRVTVKLLTFSSLYEEVQEDLMALQGQENPLDIIADEFKNKQMLCFDEFCVRYYRRHDPWHFTEGLFARGITLVATSNIIPDNLIVTVCSELVSYLLLSKLKIPDVMNVDAGIDYRLRTLTQAHLFYPHQFLKIVSI